MRILLVEDDELLGDGIKRALRRENYQVDWIMDGQNALQALQTDEFALVILDLSLPRLDGLEILRIVRKNNNPVPIIILTARDTLDDRIKGLDLGADDYLIKPFELDELLARLRSLSRRSFNRISPEIKVGRLSINSTAQTLKLDGKEVDLSRREYALLMEFVNNKERVLTRAKLEDFLYGWDGEVESNAIEVHIHYLRKKLYSDLIKTVRGVGYKLKP